MYNTAQFGLPLIQAAQAQKHITVNEALAKLDALCQLRFVSKTDTVPPVNPTDGTAYLVPVSALDDWSGHDGQIAIFSNGGWIYLDSKDGWVAYVEDSMEFIKRVSGIWVVETNGTVSAGGARTDTQIIEFDHVISAGATNSTAIVIPSNALVQAVSARVTTAIGAGVATSWRMGVSGADNRYGSSLGLGSGSYALGLTGSPQAYYSDTPILLTAEGDDFVDGSIRIAIHLVQFTPPT
jgi:hypothetical protein